MGQMAAKPNPVLWEHDCTREWNKALTGAKRHWCPDWDLLPIDETCPEFENCTCEFPDGGWPLTNNNSGAKE